MRVWHFCPYSTSKNLGAEYNSYMELLGPDDWAVIRDYDTLFLLPEQPAMIEEYVKLFPSAGLLTCYTNRISHLSNQLFCAEIDENSDIKYHIKIAEQVRVFGFNVTEITKHISGFLMVISKKTWDEISFIEGVGCIGVDTNYWQRLVVAKKKILRMDSIYLWHTYRLSTNVFDKSHLC